MKMKCPGRTAEIKRQQGLSISAIVQATGWTAFFDCSNGLESLYVCPDCTLRVKVASMGLRRIFGDRLSFIHMGHIAKLSEGV